MRNLFLALALFMTPAVFCTECVPFIRGDADQDGDVDGADAGAIQDCIDNGNCPTRLDACDWNDDGIVDGADVLAAVMFSYGQGAGPAAPFPGYGQDPTEDWLDRCCGPFPVLPYTYNHSWKAANGICNPFDIGWDIKTATWNYPVQSNTFTGCQFHWEMYTDCSNDDQHCNYGEYMAGISSPTFTIEQLEKDIKNPYLSMMYIYQISIAEPACYVPLTKQDTQINQVYFAGPIIHTITLVNAYDPTKTYDIEIQWDFFSGIEYTASPDGQSIVINESWGEGQIGGANLYAPLDDIILSTVATMQDPPNECDELKVTAWHVQSPAAVFRPARELPGMQNWSVDVSPKEQADWQYYGGFLMGF